MCVCYLQKIAKYTNRSAKLLEQRTSDAALSALEIIAEALSISLYSEKLLEMKAEALFMVCMAQLLLHSFIIVIKLLSHLIIQWLITGLCLSVYFL